VIKKHIIAFLTAIIYISISGCEDDPLLEPQTGSEEEAGSYGILSLPESDNSSSIANPEVF